MSTWRSPTTARASDLASARNPLPNNSASSADRKSTRLNSSHLVISYAVFCLKKKKTLTQGSLPIQDCDTSMCLNIVPSQATLYSANAARLHCSCHPDSHTTLVDSPIPSQPF